jgi:hypothetical protein
MNKEWQYLIQDDEIYFTSEFRFPLNRIKEVVLDKGKSGTLWIVAGVLAIVVAAAGWGVMEATQQVLLVMVGLGALLWGLKLNTTFQVGFVILKDPKYYDKVYVKVFQTHSYPKAEAKLEEIREQLRRKGYEKVRISKMV